MQLRLSCSFYVQAVVSSNTGFSPSRIINLFSIDLGFLCLLIVLELRERLRASMEEENFLRLLLTNNPPPLGSTPSSPVVSSILLGGPHPQPQAPPQEGHWSNASTFGES